MTNPPEVKEPTTALVLSGGGARGAYEVGVLKYLLTDFRKKLGRPVRFDILTGTSVGAINACFMACYAEREDYAIETLEKYWLDLRLPRVFKFGIQDLFKLPSWAFGRVGVGQSSLLDATPLRVLVEQAAPWENISRNVQTGHLKALTVTATDLESGSTLIFVEQSSGLALAQGSDPYTVSIAADINATHALASAAIPILFPPVAWEGRLLADGGVRMNTPLSPALRLGAERVLVVSLRPPAPTMRESKPFGKTVTNPNLPYLLGKNLSALMMDRLTYDCERLMRINFMIYHGQEVYGPNFLDRINESIIPFRGSPYRYVQDMVLGPSIDIAQLAEEVFRSRGKDMEGTPARMLRFMMDMGILGDTDLLSFLLFDGNYTKALIDQGFDDASGFGEELLLFFNGRNRSG